MFKKLENQIEPRLLKTLKDFFIQHFSLESKKLFVRGYMHGDANAANYIYNEATDRLWMIDLPDSASSIGKNGVPIGLPFYDLVQVQYQILMQKISGLTEEEYSQLYSTFLNHYTSAGGLLPSAETVEFFSLVNILGSLQWHYKTNEFQPGHKKALKKFYDATLKLGSVAHRFKI